MRARLVLLVVACFLPVLCLAALHEYSNYGAQRKRTLDTLLRTANTLALSVERDLQLTTVALETLSLSPLLDNSNLEPFSDQARAFLRRFPADARLSIVSADMKAWHVYTASGEVPVPLQPLNPISEPVAGGQRVISGLQQDPSSKVPIFSLYVRLPQPDQAASYLMISLPVQTLTEIVRRQSQSAEMVLTIADADGTIVTRVPDTETFIGHPVMPSLRDRLMRQNEGIARVPDPRGDPVVAMFTHIPVAHWAVIVRVPERIVFHPLWLALLDVAKAAAVALAAGLLLGALAARGITKPIERLGWVAAHDEQLDPSQQAPATGLPEADKVAHALVTAAAERRKVGAALAESEQRFRALFERAASGAILLDLETSIIVDCNEAAASFLGYRREEFKGRPITAFALRTTAEQQQEMVRAVLGGSVWRYETRVRGRYGPRDLLNAVGPVQAYGRTLALINQIDVTELRRAEADLRVNEERLQLAREGASLGIWDWDLAAETVTWSEHQWFLHGLDYRPVLPSADVWRQTIHPDDWPQVRAGLRAALKAPERRYATEYSVTLPGGGLRRLMARGLTMRDGRGRVIRMVGITMDVTARYEAEIARDRLIAMLETERGRLAEIIEALPVGVGIIDAAGQVVQGNGRLRAVTGPAIASMTDESRSEWIAVDQSGRQLEPSEFPIRRALTHGDTSLPGRDFLFRDEAGQQRWLRVGALPLRRENGRVLEALGIVQDIDAEKRLLELQRQITARLEHRVRDEMQAREAAQKRAAHIERIHALGQIAGGIAHDFNNVLQAVSGSAGLIERRPNEPERVLRNARMVLDAARRGAAITSRLLAFSRRGDLRADCIDAASLLADMAEVLTHTLGGAVICRVQAADGLPQLLADRGELETVLVNLATNARDAMPSGGELGLAADAEDVNTALPHPAGLLPGRYVRLTVSDNGAGMEPNVLARVTEPFFTTKAPGKGTGLGLAMTKDFAERSGGGLSIESTVGHGTRVSLWLPCAAEPRLVNPEGAGLSGEVAGRQSILLVDDDPIVRDVLTMSLEDAGYTVLPAENGAAAMRRLGAGDRIDIIVSDLTMPGMTGIDLIRSAQEKRPGIPAVLLTGYASDDAALAIGGAITGAFSLLRKPVSGSQLVDRINALLETRRPARMS